MAKKHLNNNGKAKCGVEVKPTRLTTETSQVSCLDCMVKGGIIKGDAIGEEIANRQAAKSRSEPDWSKKCSTCGQSPVVPETGMCGPCTFGEADTANGNW